MLLRLLDALKSHRASSSVASCRFAYVNRLQAWVGWAGRCHGAGRYVSFVLLSCLVLVAALLERLGFVLNRAKSSGIPGSGERASQQAKLLGVWIDTSTHNFSTCRARAWRRSGVLASSCWRWRSAASTCPFAFWPGSSASSSQPTSLWAQ